MKRVLTPFRSDAIKKGDGSLWPAVAPLSGNLRELLRPVSGRISPSVDRIAAALQSQLLLRSVCLSVSGRVAPSAVAASVGWNSLPRQSYVEAQIYLRPRSSSIYKVGCPVLESKPFLTFNWPRKHTEIHEIIAGALWILNCHGMHEAR